MKGTVSTRNQGFTLLELSIVLVIIALITGSIMVGSSVVRTSQLQRMIGEYDMYLKAIKEFQDKYQSLPGDYKRAETNWGADANCPNTATNTVPKVATCNGDGNGRIGASTTAGVQSSTGEWFRAWQHLANAGFIPGRFTGVANSGSVVEATPGLNVPGSALKGGGWTLNYYLLTTNGALWADTYGHLMHFGAAVANNYTYGAILTPSEAFQIDSKLDDGKPGRGTIRAWRSAVLSNCTTTDTTQDAQSYNRTYTGNACSLIFKVGF